MVVHAGSKILMHTAKRNESCTHQPNEKIEH